MDVWRFIKLRKWDLTKYGHDLGTGLVDFSESINLVEGKYASI